MRNSVSANASTSSADPPAGLSARRFSRAWLEGALARTDKPGWRAFALSMLALAAAFILALYSTIFAQQGRVMATAFSALSALALAAYVGFTAIPYLARRTRIEWLAVSLEYQLTRDGWAFIVLILLLAVAGLNTGNNLLYLILSSMLASLLMSGILSLAVLNGVNIGLELPPHVFARRPVEASVVLVNLKKFFPSFSLTLQGGAVPASGGAAAQAPWRVVLPRATVLGLVSGILASAAWLLLWKWTSNLYGLRISSMVGIALVSLVASLLMAVASLAWRERKRRLTEQVSPAGGRGSKTAADTAQGRAGPQGPNSRGILSQPLYFPFLPKGGTLRRSVELEFARRGRYREKQLDLITRFPFGFLEKTLHTGLARELLVYPAVKPSDRLIEILPLLTGELEAFQKGMGHDLYALREMHGSDSVRHVDWKASARAGSMMVREFAREDDRRVQLVLDSRVATSSGPAGWAGQNGQAGQDDSVSLERFEAGVEFCAALAWHFHEVSALFQFVCGDYRTRVAPASEIIYEILEHLAEVEPTTMDGSDARGSESAPASASTLPLGEDENAFRIICTGMPPDHFSPAQFQRTHIVYFSTLPQIG